MILISYGSITQNFKTIAKLSKILTNIQNNKIEEYRLDCYDIRHILSDNIKIEITTLFKNNNLNIPKNIEIFNPSKNYPPHIDGEGISYFIPLENGIFMINNVNYPIVPFVLYSFNDNTLHNSDFASIMLK